MIRLSICFLIAIFQLFWLDSIFAATAISKRTKSFALELTAANVTTNLEDWDVDLGIMFYAPWCKYCKQLLPIWEEIAKVLKDYKSLQLGVFNCEKPLKNADICGKLKIDRYPSIAYLGYGNFNQGPMGRIIGKNFMPSLVKFTADLYPEAIYDWLRMLHFMSSTHRYWDDFWGFFTGKSRLSKKNELLKIKIGQLENKTALYGEELEKYKSIELFDKLKNHGDPYPLLATMEPDEKNLPFRVCVGEMAAEYCKYIHEDEYCYQLPDCTSAYMEPKACRPNVCPFKNQRGCAVVSVCLQPEVIEQYKKLYNKSSK